MSKKSKFIGGFVFVHSLSFKSLFFVCFTIHVIMKVYGFFSLIFTFHNDMHTRALYVEVQGIRPNRHTYIHTYVRTHTYFDSNSNTYLWRVLVRILLSYSWRICSNVWETFKSLRLRRQGTVQKATQIRTLYSISNTADIIIFPFFHAYRLFGRHQNINKKCCYIWLLRRQHIVSVCVFHEVICVCVCE